MMFTVWTFEIFKKSIFGHNFFLVDGIGLKFWGRMLSNIRIWMRCSNLDFGHNNVAKDVKVTFCDKYILRDKSMINNEILPLKYGRIYDIVTLIDNWQ